LPDLAVIMRKGPTALPRAIRHYVLGDVIGSGSFSTVCKAMSTQDHRTYACKVIGREQISGAGDWDRFQREVDAMTRIRHENLVALHDFDSDDHNFYLIMELLQGGELLEYMNKTGRIDEPTAALIFRQVVAGVRQCHMRGICHRDLKPANILFDVFPRVKVSDFGLCGYIQADRMMATFCGSPLYCAPECLSRVQYDGRMSDVWSLGVMLFAMVTGDNPWKYGNMSQMVSQIMSASFTIPDFVSAGCQELICAMLQVAPHSRIAVRDVINHRWIELADGASIKVPEPKLPPLGGHSLEQVAHMARAKSRTTNAGIYSPFEEDPPADDDEEAPMPLSGFRQPSLPRLCVRSESFEELPGTGDGNRRFANRNISLGGNRQRSATLLVSRKPGQDQRPDLLMTICE